MNVDYFVSILCFFVRQDQVGIGYGKAREQLFSKAGLLWDGLLLSTTNSSRRFIIYDRRCDRGRRFVRDKLGCLSLQGIASQKIIQSAIVGICFAE